MKKNPQVNPADMGSDDYKNLVDLLSVFSEATHRRDVVHLHAIEVILTLRVEQAEHRVGVRLAVDVRYPPLVPNDGDAFCLLLPGGDFLTGERLGNQRTRSEQEYYQTENNQHLSSCSHKPGVKMAKPSEWFFQPVKYK